MKAKRNIGLEILEGIRHIKTYKAGEGTLRVRKITCPELQDEMLWDAQFAETTHQRVDGLAASVNAEIDAENLSDN